MTTLFASLGGFPTLETPRLLLREPRPEDADHYLAMLADLEVRRFLSEEQPRTVEDSLRGFRQLKSPLRGEHLMLPWAIVLKSEKELIGGIRFFAFTGHNYLIGEVGYELARPHWNQGYMTEALQAVVAFGFDRLHLERIQATTHPLNFGSRRVARKAGFTEEGILRSWGYDESRQMWVDAVMLAITRHDYHP